MFFFSSSSHCFCYLKKSVSRKSANASIEIRQNTLIDCCQDVWVVLNIVLQIGNCTACQTSSTVADWRLWGSTYSLTHGLVIDNNDEEIAQRARNNKKRCCKQRVLCFRNFNLSSTQIHTKKIIFPIKMIKSKVLPITHAQNAFQVYAQITQITQIGYVRSHPLALIKSPWINCWIGT